MQNGAGTSSYITTQNTSSGIIEGAASSSTGANKESLKTQFITREGVYKQMTVSDQLSRPHRVQPAQGAGNPVFNAPVRVSFARITSAAPSNEESASTQLDENGELMAPAEESSVMERICFNIGRELFVYDFHANGTFDWSKPIDKRIYKGTYPTCHDFNAVTMTAQSCQLLVGFSAGQIQLIDPFQKEFQNSRLYNEDRLIDKTPVTCLKWLPNQSQLFIASHSSGYMYVYNEEYSCAANAPTYVNLKQGEGFTVSNVKSRVQQKNPIQRWSVGKGAINQFEFGGLNSAFMATVSQDGFLRVFKYATMELTCLMRSYFGGLLCLAWSADHKLIATGGEDDLLTVYSVPEKRVLCRGQGHKSWVSQVAFDPYTSGNPATMSGSSMHSGIGAMGTTIGSVSSTEELRPAAASVHVNGPSTTTINPIKQSNGTETRVTTNGKSASLGDRRQYMLFDEQRSRLNSFEQQHNSIVYRIGSVSADTQLCFWDVTDELLGPAFVSNGTANASGSGPGHSGSASGVQITENNLMPESSSSNTKDGALKESKTSRLKKLHKRGLSFGNRHANQTDRWSRANLPISRSTAASNSTQNDDPSNPDRVNNLFGTPQCPKMDQTPIIEPLICKKISHERLTVLCFREDCLVTGCQEGYICTWARPNRISRL